MLVRDEKPGDISAISALMTDAFRDAAHSSGTEAAIVERLRKGGALTVSLVADEAGQIAGHIAFSPVRINGEASNWYGLGPVAVRPDKQKLGVGRLLITTGLDRLRSLGAGGCVVLGDPHYYGAFGFVSDPALRYADVPAGYFRRLTFDGSSPHGVVEYHPAFA